MQNHANTLPRTNENDSTITSNIGSSFGGRGQKVPTTSHGALDATWARPVAPAVLVEIFSSWIYLQWNESFALSLRHHINIHLYTSMLSRKQKLVEAVGCIKLVWQHVIRILLMQRQLCFWVRFHTTNQQSMRKWRLFLRNEKIMQIIPQGGLSDGSDVVKQVPTTQISLMLWDA